MSPRNLTGVVFGVIGLYFVFRTGLGTMLSVPAVFEDVWADTMRPNLGRLYLLSEGWQLAARSAASVLPFLCSLVVLANRWTLASRLTGPADEENERLSLQSLKCAGFVSTGLFLALDGLDGLGVNFSSNYAWLVPIEAKYAVGDSITAVLGVVLVFSGPFLSLPMGITTVSGDQA